MTPPISVILCTHNPRADYLRRTLDSLRSQTLSRDRWELLLVDNASDPHVAESWDLSWHPRSGHIREEELGLTAARLRGIGEAQGDLLVFVDDDNVLAPDFLENASPLLAQHPHLGVFGAGVLEPEFEIPPPPELLPRISLLTLRTVPSPRWSNNMRDYTCIPWGAGMGVARRLADRYRDIVSRLALNGVVGRRGNRLFCGEDDIFSWIATASGLGFGLFPQLRITHLISSGRLSQRHFLRLTRDSAFSHGILDSIFAESTYRPPGPAQLTRLLLHGARHGLFSMRCEWTALQGAAAADRFVREKAIEPVPLARWLDDASLATRGGPAAPAASP